jgi:hypothetical protein
MSETQDESDRGAHLQLLEGIGFFGQLWPKADSATGRGGCLQNAKRQSDNGSVRTNTGLLLSVNRLNRHLHRARIPSYFSNHGVQPHSEEIWSAGGRERSNQTLVSLGKTEAAVSLDFPVASMPSRQRMSADAACVTCVEVLDIRGSFDPRVLR